MWQTSSLWFEVAIVSMVFTFGHIFFGHFEERTPRGRLVLKYVFALILMCVISHFMSRTVALIFLGLWVIPLIYVHGYLLPKKGINGLTGEPKSKYYELRGWDTDIFKEK
jgi:hypothetical protein